MGKTVTTNY